MIEVDYKANYGRSIRAINRMASVVDDIGIVSKDFLAEYKKLLKINYETRGKLFQSGGWPDYSISYQKKVGRKSATLIRSKLMKQKALAPVIKKTGKHFTFVWHLPDYWKYHQQENNPTLSKIGKMPKRSFIWAFNNELPLRALRILINLLEKQIEKAAE